MRFVKVVETRRYEKLEPLPMDDILWGRPPVTVSVIKVIAEETAREIDAYALFLKARKENCSECAIWWEGECPGSLDCQIVKDCIEREMKNVKGYQNHM